MSGSTIERAAVADLVRDLTASSGDTVTVIAPFTGKPLHELPISTVQDVAEATAAARVAQAAWWAAGDAHRRRVLLRAHDLLLERRETLLDAVQSETGKTRGQAFEEVFNAGNSTRYNALSARRVLKGGRRRGGIPFVFVPRVHYTPKGVIGVITPWNYPLALAIMDIAAALAAGNGIVQKADNQGVLSILTARRAFVDAGLPAALWAVVAGEGSVVGNAVVDAGDYVVFTGSTATGRKVAERAAARLVGASMELGGKNALIVLADADLDRAAEAAVRDCFTGAGQLCVSMERLYVAEAVHDAFLARFLQRVRRLRLGTALDYSVDVGSLLSTAQLERVTAHVGDAVAKGAAVLAGGRPRPDVGPLFYEPTVLSGVTEAMMLCREETFGPVVAVRSVADEHEAVSLANDSAYGLHAGVWTRDVVRGRTVAARLETGTVSLNETYGAAWGATAAPMGGRKDSGLGRRHGREGLLKYTEPQTVAAQHLVGFAPTDALPFDRWATGFTTALRVMKALGRR